MAAGAWRTPRLRLEPLGPEHADDVWRLYQDPAVVAWDAGPFSRAEAAGFAERWARRWVEDGVGKWIAHRHDGTLVGRGGLSRLPAGTPTAAQIAALVPDGWEPHRLEVGWALLSQHHGHGYATEIGRAALDCARTVLGARAVVSFTERHHAASRRVMAHLGLDPVGEITAPGLVEGRAGLHDDAPFAVSAARLDPDGPATGGPGQDRQVPP